MDYLLNRKLCDYQDVFAKICNLVQYSSEYFEPVRDGGFTAEGFAIFYEKAKFDLVGR